MKNSNTFERFAVVGFAKAAFATILSLTMSRLLSEKHRLFSSTRHQAVVKVIFASPKGFSDALPHA